MSEIDWDHRILCPDGACNGLVGPDGQCKVCGMIVPNWAEERTRGLQEDPDEPDEDEADEDEDDEDNDEYEDDDREPAAEHEGEWTDRKLCDDGACVGVIGPDGTCTVCGKQSAA